MVNITKFAVRKPVTIIMCLITIAYFGIQALMGDEGRADAGNGTSCSADQYRICGRYP